MCSSSTLISYIKNLGRRFSIILPSFQNKQQRHVTELLKIAIDYHQKGQLEKAEQHYRKILQSNPEHTDTLHLLGVLVSQTGQYELAVELINHAIRISPTVPAYYNNLGTIHYHKGHYNDAIKAYEQALKLNPDFADVYFGIGNSLFQLRQFEAAVVSYQKAIDLNPEHIDAHYNLGNSLRELGQLEAAVSAFKKTLLLNPDFVEAHNNLGFALQEQGDINEAINCYERALTIKPDFTNAHSNLLNCLNYHFDIKPKELYARHLQWAQQHAMPMVDKLPDHTNTPDPNRRLRVGYVSPDFRKHSIAIFIEPVFRVYNRNNFDIIAYYNYEHKDSVTERLHEFVDKWRNIAGMDNEQVAELICKDAIDILVDLTGHTANNRLQVFALKPAPVQVTYLGYATTTGLSTMDYRLTDAWADPPGQTERYFTEKLVRLPDCFLCYQPPAECPDVGDLPAFTTAHITIGCFNNATKLNNNAIAVWARILHKIPGSRLFLKATQFNDTATRNSIRIMFKQHGIVSERIDFAGLMASFYEHLDMYNKVDFALDTFPYNGTTTTCETLWMGVPVITLPGDVHQSRVGCSILSNVGLSQFIAETPDDFIEKATNLASDLNALSDIRKGLRNRMRHSSITDARKFTTSLEQTYRKLWTTWCKKHIVENS